MTTGELPLTRPTKGVEGALKILEFLGGWRGPANLPRPMAATLNYIAAGCGIPEPTAYRLLSALVETGWLERAGTEYRLALKVGLLGLGIHASLKAQAESLAGSIAQLDAVAEHAGR